MCMCVCDNPAAHTSALKDLEAHRCRLCAVGTFQMRVCSSVTWEWEPQPHNPLVPRSRWLWQQEV